MTPMTLYLNNASSSGAINVLMIWLKKFTFLCIVSGCLFHQTTGVQHACWSCPSHTSESVIERSCTCCQPLLKECAWWVTSV